MLLGTLSEPNTDAEKEENSLAAGCFLTADGRFMAVHLSVEPKTTLHVYAYEKV